MSNKLGKVLLAAWLLGVFDNKEKSAQDLYYEGYSPEEIADELDIDEDDVRDIVGEDDYDDHNHDDFDDFDDYDY